MDFKSLNIHHLILEAIDAQGFTEPTPVQADVIPEALKGRDIRACAQTGTGKTVAFVIPILNHLIKNPDSQALVIVPTRELGSQVFKVFNQIGKVMKIKSVLILGGMKMGMQMRAIRDGSEIIVATPGRLTDHLERGTLKLDKIKILVLDEADRMLDMGFLPDIRRIISRISNQRQTLLFSATYPPEIEKLTAQFQNNPVKINLAASTPANTVSQELYPVVNEQKSDLLQCLIEKAEAPTIIIFCRTKRRVNRLVNGLQKIRKSVAGLHSDKTQSQRTRVIHAFSQKQIQILVATDIASRGLDIKDVSHVINYDVPTHPEDYVHRVGRTGRAKATGLAITLVAPEEESHIASIEKFIKKPVPRKLLDTFPYKVAPHMTTTAKPTAPGRGHSGPRRHSRPHSRPKQRSGFSPNPSGEPRPSRVQWESRPNQKQKPKWKKFSKNRKKFS